MSAPQQNYSDHGQKNTYVFTEEEARVIMECRTESFWFRSLPFAALGMAATQALISRGVLTTSTRFGSLPKVAFAGFMGYIAGKASYVKVCKDKLMKLENSPMAEQLRKVQFHKEQFPHSQDGNAAYSNDEFASTPAIPQSPAPLMPELPSPSTSHPADVPFSSSMSESSPSGITDNLAREPEYFEEKQTKPPPVTYEQLRNKNRGAYDVLTPQTQERPIQNRAPRIEVKKNKYGDVWEE